MAAEPLPMETEEAVQAEAMTLADQTATITVSNQMEFEAASSFLTEKIQPAIRKVTDFFKPMKDAAFKAHRAICDKEKTTLAPLVDAEKTVKGALAGYAAEQDRLRREAEAAAARAAAEEQARLETQRRAEAEALADAGQTEAACELLDAPAPVAFVPAPVVAKPTAEGVTVRKRWTFRIVDETRIPRKFLLVDEKKIRALVAAIGPDASNQIPGIIVEQEFGVAARSRG